VPAEAMRPVADQIMIARELEHNRVIIVGFEVTPHGRRRMIGTRTPKRGIFIPRTPIAAVQRMLLTDDPDGCGRLSSHRRLRILFKCRNGSLGGRSLVSACPLIPDHAGAGKLRPVTNFAPRRLLQLDRAPEGCR